MDKRYVKGKPQYHQRKEKRLRKHNYNYNFDYDWDSRSRSRDRSYSNHIVQTDHETTTEMTIGQKIIGGPRITSTEIDIEIITDAHMKIGIRTVIKISIKTGMKIDIETSTEITIEMIAMTEIEVGLEKDIAHITLEKMMVFSVTIQELNDCTKSCNG